MSNENKDNTNNEILPEEESAAGDVPAEKSDTSEENINISNEEISAYYAESENSDEASDEEISDDTESDLDNDNDDDFDEDSSSIDLPLPTKEELENTVDVDLPEFVQKKPFSLRESKFFKWLLIILGSILAILIIIYAACIVTLPTDTIAKGIYIENIDVSGLTYDQALNSIGEEYTMENKQITLTKNGQVYAIPGADINLTANIEETVKKAFDYGKSGNKLLDGFSAMKLLVSDNKIIPVASADEELLKEKLNEFGLQVFGERKNHYVEITEEKTVVWPGTTGYDGNPDAACADVIEAIANESFTNISVDLASAPPDELTLEQFDLLVYKDPVDAYFKIEDNTATVVEAENGRYINKEEAAPLLKTVVEGGGPVDIPYYVSTPTVTSEELSSKLFANTMASYSTSFASSTANRATNVARAASLINGKIIGPGEVFSFNDTVGKRTVANGFKTAPEYVNGKTVEGIGGGTCQVSSTLYNAVLYADLEIVTRTNHIFTVSYVPNGQDATVADYGPDFKFKNNTNYPIKISAYTSGGQITVSIIGTNWEPKREVKINNSTSYGSNGNTNVRTTRTVYVNGEVLRTDNLPSSSYRPHTEEAEQEAAATSSQAEASESDDEEDEDVQIPSQSVSQPAVVERYTEPEPEIDISSVYSESDYSEPVSEPDVDSDSEYSVTEE